MRTRLFAVVLQATLVSGAILGAESRDSGDLLIQLKQSNPPVRLLSAGWKASWDPTGKRLVYGVGMGQGIEILDLETMSRQRLLPRGKDPVWSPDGGHVAYVVDLAPNAYSSETVWIVGPDGEGLRIVAHGGFPSWSTDGSQLYFHSRVHNRVEVVRVEDSAKPTVVYPDATSYYFAVSPDAKRIAFGSRESLDVVECASRSTLLSWPTPGERGTLPAWSPDGRFVAFGGFDDSTAGLRLLDVEKARAVTLARGPCTMPAWSSDGRWLAFDLRTGDRSVWVVGREWLLKRLNDAVPVCSLGE